MRDTFSASKSPVSDLTASAAAAGDNSTVVRACDVASVASLAPAAGLARASAAGVAAFCGLGLLSS
jgi:hypothetical protein